MLNEPKEVRDAKNKLVMNDQDVKVLAEYARQRFFPVQKIRLIDGKRLKTLDE